MYAQRPAPPRRPAQPCAPCPACPCLEPPRLSEAAERSSAIALRRGGSRRRAQPKRPSAPSVQAPHPRPRQGDEIMGELADCAGDCFECPLCPLHEMSARSSIAAKLALVGAPGPRSPTPPQAWWLAALAGHAPRRRPTPRSLQGPRQSRADGHAGPSLRRIATLSDLRGGQRPSMEPLVLWRRNDRRRQLAAVEDS
jgi:hypothetical protein